MGKYIIELRGVEFHNKGAELMLYAILDAVKASIPSAIIVMEKSVSAPTHKQRQLGIFTKLNSRRFGLNMAVWGRFIPRDIRRKLGYIMESEINIVMDGSGFAFGDFWGAKKAGNRLADHIARWKKQGKKIVVLPQAFGAFTDPALREKMNHILNFSDLLFARDQYSYKYLNHLEGDKSRIHLKPDFTNLIKGKVPPNFDVRKCEVAIIPNNKLLESQTFPSRDSYLSFLKKIIEYILSRGFKPFFLIHEGEKDLKLAEEVNANLVSKAPILMEENPLYVKGIIGASRSIVTSRFHGLVSALSQAIPCLCVGWSHKYQALMEDYGHAEGALLDSDLLGSSLEEKLSLLLDTESASKIKKKLSESSREQKERAKEMWELVFDTIK